MKSPTTDSISTIQPSLLPTPAVHHHDDYNDIHETCSSHCRLSITIAMTRSVLSTRIHDTMTSISSTSSSTTDITRDAVGLHRCLSAGSWQLSSASLHDGICRLLGGNLYTCAGMVMCFLLLLLRGFYCGHGGERLNASAYREQRGHCEVMVIAGAENNGGWEAVFFLRVHESVQSRLRMYLAAADLVLICSSLPVTVLSACLRCYCRLRRH